MFAFGISINAFGSPVGEKNHLINRKTEIKMREKREKRKKKKREKERKREMYW